MHIKRELECAPGFIAPHCSFKRFCEGLACMPPRCKIQYRINNLEKSASWLRRPAQEIVFTPASEVALLRARKGRGASSSSSSSSFAHPSSSSSCSLFPLRPHPLPSLPPLSSLSSCDGGAIMAVSRRSLNGVWCDRRAEGTVIPLSSLRIPPKTPGWSAPA